MKRLTRIAICKLAAALSACARMLYRFAMRGEASISLHQMQSGRALFRTPDGFLFWLDRRSTVDQCIIRDGVFEQKGTALVKRLVKPGQTVLDVGANIGYYAVIASRLVGPQGVVHAFEPTTIFADVLDRNLRENGVTNCEVHRFGFSDRSHRGNIKINESSATLHMPDDCPACTQQAISLTTLNAFAARSRIKSVDFVKVDIDGHEPFFMEGAWRALAKWKPILLLEVSNLHYSLAGYSAWEFYDALKAKGYYIYREEKLTPYRDRIEFIRECGSFTRSANIVLSLRSLAQGV
ncbi:MAG: FkbM family methyltransferase [Candidatus Edwardsbacteria bacterium]|jgi:FkbM family methyltransferase|nr:FkbM family methyltransferase [Candidatus Edwardsbacteria bacterium]